MTKCAMKNCKNKTYPLSDYCANHLGPKYKFEHPPLVDDSGDQYSEKAMRGDYK